MSNNLKYEEIQPRPRAELEAAFLSDDPDTICNALWSAAQHEDDWRWSQAQCLKMLNHESLLVRSCAIVAIGEIATFRGSLEVKTVVSELNRVAVEPSLAPFVEDCLDDIRAAGLLQDGDPV